MQQHCLLIAINTKYIHTNLAVRYLERYSRLRQRSLEVMEFSINDSLGSILGKIYSGSRKVYAFSCYIWNIDMVLKLCSSIKRLNPEAAILLGGPEVSFDASQLLAQHPYIDYILRGEGEESLPELLQLLGAKNADLSTVKGLTYREADTVIDNPDRPLMQDLDIIPFPYEDLSLLQNKIIYYETSRGCPFNCQYCLSSTIHGVRTFSMERIKEDIRRFVEHGVKQVKLVDRTFNCNKKHSLEILRYIIGLGGKTNFHFEIAADLLDEEMLCVLAAAPKDMFQFEIGVQSTNEAALREISRAMSLDRVKSNVRALQQAKNSHLHLDLIAGLPYEDYTSFGKSFDEIHQLKPDMLQLGFLKLLKGSGLRKRAEEYGIEYNAFNPYEVLKTRWISFEELLKLKEIEHLLELYYNSGRFRNSLSYLFGRHYFSYFAFYEAFAAFWQAQGLYEASQSTRELYNILWDFAEAQGILCTALNELIKLDWLLYYNNGNMPARLKRYDHTGVKTAIQEFIKASGTAFAPQLSQEELSPKNLLKQVTYEVFYTDVLEDPTRQCETVVFLSRKPEGNLTITGIPLAQICHPF